MSRREDDGRAAPDRADPILWDREADAYGLRALVDCQSQFPEWRPLVCRGRVEDKHGVVLWKDEHAHRSRRAAGMCADVARRRLARERWWGEVAARARANAAREAPRDSGQLRG